ncbi:MAG: hypothetical protein ACE5GM_11400 [bacterium]
MTNIPDKSLWYWLTYDPLGLGLLILLIIAILVNFGFMFLGYRKQRVTKRRNGS